MSNGEETTIDVLDIKQIQEFIGGNVEQVGNIICNDDGIRLGLLRNIKYPNFLGNIIIENR